MQILINFLLILSLSIATLSDIKYTTIPNICHYILIFASIINILSFRVNPIPLIISSIFIFMVLYLIDLSLGGTSLGGGDLKLATSFAFLTGYYIALYGLLISFILLSSYKLIFKKRGQIKFAPILSLGFIMSYFL